MTHTINAIIRQMLAFLLLCVAVMSVDAKAEVTLDEYDVFRGIQCQVYADYAGFDDAVTSWWERNNTYLDDHELGLTSFDVAYVVNTQFDHAITKMLDVKDVRGVSEKEASEYLYIKYCNN